jgi:hypothetical protein
LNEEVHRYLSYYDNQDKNRRDEKMFADRAHLKRAAREHYFDYVVPVLMTNLQI